MAQVAQGANCPACNTLTACSGSFSDEYLTAQCGCCKRPVQTPNLQYVGTPTPAAIAEEPVVEVAPAEPEEEIELEGDYHNG